MSNPQPPRVTLHDVARQAEVSYQTVSRVINGNPHVAKETRERILRAIKDLNYRPNAAARSLVTRRSNLIEIITFGGSYYGPAQMVLHVERAARQQGYNLLVSYVTEMSLKEIEVAMSSLSGQLVDGIILITPMFGVDYEELLVLCQGTPFVMIDTQVGAVSPSVVIHQSFGGQLAAQHLIDLGHKQICEISGPLDWYAGKARHESWLATIAAAGLQPGISVEGDWTALGGYAAAQRLLDTGISFTGLVVGNDQMALGAMRALRERGLHIPEDISVVGFDDIPESACFEPPLTTIRQDFAMVGRQSMDYLFDLMHQEDTPLQQRVLYPTLVERQSTRAFR